MKIHNLIQGSPEWLAYRATHYNASDAPAMMGCSPYKTRAELLREMHTGISPEVDAATQKRFDNGHRAEALARPLAEKIIGAVLYPVVGSEGLLSASFDGLTIDGREGFEHKALNADLKTTFADMVYIAPELLDAGAGGIRLPIYHRIQMEQQLFVSGAERILFMASEWGNDGALLEEHHCWYYPDHVLRQQIIDGWAQLERDLAAYVLPEASEPAPVGRAPETLPALCIEITGAVMASNLAEFKATALGAIRAVNRDLQTDQDFADAKKAVRWCEEIEDKVERAKERALSQASSIEAVFSTLDEIAAESKDVRLSLDRLVKRRSVEIKEAEVMKAREAFAIHMNAVNADIAPARLEYAAGFGEAIKGLKTIDSVRARLDAALAAAKVAADSKAREIRANQAHFKAAAEGMEHLFADIATLVHKPCDDFRTLVAARIETHKAAEARKETERQAAEAARIAAVEQRAREEAAAASAPAPTSSNDNGASSEELEFVHEVAAAFASDQRMNSYGELTPGSLLAIRWGIHGRAIKVVRLAEDFEPVVYADAVPLSTAAA